ncbi:MAG: hypothetical protein GYA24_17760 [Candidatus Lokiarchaeota archaeon]|nr:hypothetical protein [Candidatus Lokiarchaeota archaeon]
MIVNYPDTVPLTGPFRIPLMLLNICLVIASLNVALIHVKKHVTLRDSIKGTRVHAAWASLFLGYALMISCYFIGMLYTSTLDQRYKFLQVGYVCGATGGFFYIYYIEQLAYITRRRTFTLIFGTLYVVLVCMFFTALIVDLGNIVQLFMTSFWIPNLGFMIVYLYKINKLSIGKLRRMVSLVVTGFCLLILGVLGSTDAVQRPLGLGVRLLADACQVGGVIMVGWYSSKLPSWKELEWETALDSLYIVYKGGVLAYEYEFNEASHNTGQPRAAAAVSALEAVRLLLDQVVDSGQLKIIDFKKKKLFFDIGDYITVIMVANEQLDTLDFLIRKIRKEIEKAFAGMLPTWDGTSASFAPATRIINRILS